MADNDQQIEFMNVTPDQAADWLADSGLNRPVNQNRVDAYARDMVAGRWRVTGDAITFDRDGVLRQGQHRLRAVVQSGATVRLAVMLGLEPEDFDVLDQGMKRNFGQVLAIRGHKNYVPIASAARLLNGFERTGALGEGGRQTTIAELSDTVGRWPELDDFGTLANRVNANARVPRGVALALCCIFARAEGRPEAESFFDLVATGAGLDDGDPVLALRRSLARSGPTFRPSQKEVAAWTIKAFNTWRRGARVEIITWKGGGSKPEHFPRVEGYPYERLPVS